MENQIFVREAFTETDILSFWEQLYEYLRRDIFPDIADEDKEYFMSDEYRSAVKMLHDRQEDRCHYLFFELDGRDIGFALPVIYNTEDGKCFIMEYCIYPKFRGKGIGRRCADVLMSWAKANGSLYAELNCTQNEQRISFWKSVGFIENGVDEWGEPLMLMPPEDNVPIEVDILDEPDDWQFRKLENGFLKEIGEQALTDDSFERLKQAVRDKRITFFVAKRGSRSVGICSVSACFSTFECADTGVFEDFYIEPAFRRKGIAGKLTKAAKEWCRSNKILSLTVCCAPCDQKMYQSLGFDAELGTTFACIM